MVKPKSMKKAAADKGALNCPSLPSLLITARVCREADLASRYLLAKR